MIKIQTKMQVIFYVTLLMIQTAIRIYRQALLQKYRQVFDPFSQQTLLVALIR